MITGLPGKGSRLMEKEKLEAIKQWTNDPCGTVAGDFEEGSKEFFEAVAKNRYKAYAPWLKKLIDGIDVKDKTVLELGCGLGTDLMSFARNGAKVIGLDLTPKHIEFAKKLFKISNMPAEFVLGDAESMDIPSESIDVVYSFGVLHHTPHIDKAVAEIQRVLKPGGLAVVGLYHKNSWQYWINIFLIHGVFKRKLANMTMNDLLSSVIEYSTSGARPLVNVYTKSDCRRMFKKFTGIKIKNDHWTRDQIPSRIGSIMPAFLPSFLGWYIMVFARK
jgi:ubiquinone/menaquinone biosynthesis C-methylase UbiE